MGYNIGYKIVFIIKFKVNFITPCISNIYVKEKINFNACLASRLTL